MKIFKIYIALIVILAGLNGVVFRTFGQDAKQYSIKIKVKYALNKPGDTLSLSFGPQSIVQSIRSTYKGIVDHNGIVNFNVKQDFPFGYISIQKVKPHPKWKNDNRNLALNLFWEDGDDITIDVGNNQGINDYLTNTKFYGKGAIKYNTIYQTRQELVNYFKEVQSNPDIKIASYTNPLIDTIPIDRESNSRLLPLLEKQKNNISSLAYEVLKTDILMRRRQEIAEYLNGYIYKNLNDKPQAVRSQFADRLMSTFFPYPDFSVSEQGFAASYEFNKGYGNLIYLVASLRNSVPNFSNILHEIKVIGNGAREQSIMLSALNLAGMKEDKSGLSHVRDFIKIPRYKMMLEKHQGMMGKNIAGFQFYNTSGEKIDLGSFKGKLLLIDFWFSGCGACAYYYQNILSKVEEEFKNDPRFEVLSISCDTKKEMWLKSIKNNTYSNINCINLNTGPEGELHPFYSYMGIYKSPCVMLVDQNGAVIVLDTPELRTNSELLSKTIKKYL